jgi:hypothetical protein
MADLVTLWSKTADFSDAVPEFPGVIAKATFDAGISVDFHGDDGTYLTEDLAVSYTDSSATITLADASNLELGMYAYLVTADGGNQDGYYEITGIVSNTITIDDQNLTGGVLTADDTVDVFIGGVSDAFDGSGPLQEELDLIGPNCGASNGDAVNNLDILCHASTATTLTATLDIDNISGSISTRVKTIATNSSFVDDGTLVEWTTTSTLANGLMDFPVSGASVQVEFINFDCNGGGRDSAPDRAEFCVNESVGTGGTDSVYFTSCTFRGANSHGVKQESDFWVMTNCTFSENGGSGMDTTASDGTSNKFISCDFTDNTTHGLNQTGGNATIKDCTASDNGSRGFSLGGNGADNTQLYNNSADNNGSDGFYNSATAAANVYLNNTSSNNTGYGFFFVGNERANILRFSNNNAFGNRSGFSNEPSNLATTDALFQVFSSGDNITADPDFTSTTPGDAGFFIPSSTSPLIDAGVGGTGYTIGAKCATAGGGGGTTGISKSRAFGAI